MSTGKECRYEAGVRLPPKLLSSKDYRHLLASHDLRAKGSIPLLYTQHNEHVIDDIPLGRRKGYYYFLRSWIEAHASDEKGKPALISRYYEDQMGGKTIYGISIGELVCHSNDMEEKTSTDYCVILDADHKVYIAWDCFVRYGMDRDTDAPAHEDGERKLPGDDELSFGMARISRENWEETPDDGITGEWLTIHIEFPGMVYKQPVTVQSWLDSEKEAQ